MNIKELIERSHKIAIEHGWWDEPRPLAVSLCLIHSEISEALEEDRNHHLPNETYYSGKVKKNNNTTIVTRANKCELKTFDGENFVSLGLIIDKPEGVPSELADAVIRIADLCGYYGINLEKAIEEKMSYNEKREYKHGGKKE